ncbi:MAG TPA: hypothetical protein VIU61_14925 [Kofleriaceae bacterium]
MVERPDIDALLIGALYGELAPADEARLTAHFESHPGDRALLAAMTDTRQAVRESRILQVQFEPPQSVSALLLQEAARRAPRKVEQKEPSEGWFARFMRSFVAHPAMAAAAMLVIVVGVAGTMYLRKGDQFAEKTYETAPAPAAGSASSTIVAAEQPTLNEAEKLQQQAGSAYGVELAGKLDDGDDRLRKEEDAKANAPAKNGAYIEITPPAVEPKELPERQQVAKKPAPKTPVAKGGKVASPEDGFAVEGRTSTAKPADPAAAPTTGESAPQASPPPPAPAGGAARAKDKTVTTDAAKVESKADGSQLVRDLHARLVNQVKAGNCREAAGLAIEIVSRDRAYYSQNVETDRSVKPCIAYITAERERDAEKSQKRATSKTRADEPAKPSTSTK